MEIHSESFSTILNSKGKVRAGLKGIEAIASLTPKPVSLDQFKELLKKNKILVKNCVGRLGSVGPDEMRVVVSFDGIECVSTVVDFPTGRLRLRPVERCSFTFKQSSPPCIWP